MTIVNDDSRVVNKLEASLTGDPRVIIYDRHMFVVQATVCQNKARYAECICAECHYAECRYAECRGTTHRIEWQNNVLTQFHIIMFFLTKKRFFAIVSVLVPTAAFEPV